MKIQVLDHGYVEFIESWGRGKAGPRHDLRRPYRPGEIPMGKDDFEVGIIEAARQSTQGSFKGWDPASCDCGVKAGIPIVPQHEETCASVRNPGDRKLLKYLNDKKHSTPFEFAGLVLEIQAPIMVFREWHRHRTQSYSEMSARYAPLPALHYHMELPGVLERAEAARNTANKQARAATEIQGDLDIIGIHKWLHDDTWISGILDDHYQTGLKLGIPKEIARKKMPVDHYSRMRASANLRNWLAFLTLRTDPAAQWEIRQYAEAVASIIEKTFPHTYDLWSIEHRVI